MEQGGRLGGSPKAEAKGFAPTSVVLVIELKACFRPGEKQHHRGVQARCESNGPGNFVRAAYRHIQVNQTAFLSTGKKHHQREDTVTQTVSTGARIIK